MSDTAYRVKASWGNVSVSYFYFSTEAEARDFSPAKATFDLFTGASSGVRYPRCVTIQKRGPRGGYKSVKPAAPHPTPAEEAGHADAN